MLINEARFTPLTIDIKNQIKRLISTFYRENIEKRGKLSNLTLDQAKQNVRKMISNSEYQAIYIGSINLGKELNKEIPVFIKEDTGASGTYYEEDDNHYEHIIISFNTIFGELDYTLSVLAHEVIHAIQKYKKASQKYYDVTNKIDKNSETTQEEDFIYYTEPAEFEANSSQLAYIITRYYERKDVDKEKVLFVLENVLKFPKQKMYKFFNSFYIKYLINLEEKDQELMMSYLREMFINKMNFLRNIATPPNNKLENTRKSDRCWRQFKQKLFNLIQNLKRRFAKSKAGIAAANRPAPSGAA
jgi:hypothetical protein